MGQALWYRLEAPGQIDAIRINASIYDFSTYVLQVTPPAQYVIVIAVSAVALRVMFLPWRRFQDVAAVTSASTIATLLLTPYALQYDYVPLTIPVFWMFSRSGSLPRAIRWAVAVLLCVSVLIWQEWSYQGYWQRLGIFAAFSLVAASMVRDSRREGRSRGLDSWKPPAGCPPACWGRKAGVPKARVERVLPQEPVPVGNEGS